MSTVAGDEKFERKVAILYVPIVIFLTKDNVNLTKHSCERFKRSPYWNQYKRAIK